MERVIFSLKKVAARGAICAKCLAKSSQKQESKCRPATLVASNSNIKWQKVLTCTSNYTLTFTTFYFETDWLHMYWLDCHLPLKQYCFTGPSGIIYIMKQWFMSLLSRRLECCKSTAWLGYTNETWISWLNQVTSGSYTAQHSSWNVHSPLVNLLGGGFS